MFGCEAGAIKVPRLDAYDEAGRVLLHQTVQRGLLGPMALVVDRGTIRRPLGLPADGLHALLPSL